MDTFTRWRKYYLTNGCFRPDRRGRFTAGFLLRHDDLKLALSQWLLGRTKRDINISDVRYVACTSTSAHIHIHACTRANTVTLTHLIQTRDFINNSLLKEFPIGKIDKCSGLCRPVSYETTHQWMLGCGCQYKPFKKTYYNDTHERHDNQLDRVTKATRHAYTSFREEKW